MSRPFNDIMAEVRDGLPVCAGEDDCRVHVGLSGTGMPCSSKEPCRCLCLLAVRRYVAIGEAARKNMNGLVDEGRALDRIDAALHDANANLGD